LNLILEYCPKKYAIRMGINEKAIFFSKRPYSENATNIEAKIIIKIKSNSLFFI
jgi:phage-related protein